MTAITLAAAINFTCHFFSAFQELQIVGAHLARIHGK